MKSNKAVKRAVTPVVTHEGGKGQSFTPFKELERTVLNCLLFEDSYYESGTDIAKRIAELVAKSTPSRVADLAIKARDEFYLRHVPLFLVRELSRTKQGAPYVEDTLEHIIQRPDELTEYVVLHDEVKPNKYVLSAASKRGLAKAFRKFNEYQLAKWNSSKAKIRLRNVIRMVHPTPTPYIKGSGKENQAKVWKRLVADELKTPDTWEAALCSGKDKKETFTRLIAEKKLGGIALLSNLRGCLEAGVSKALLKSAINEHPFPKVLPFRFIAAARHAPVLEAELDAAMARAANTLIRMPGKTAFLIDVSGSMEGAMSAKSDLTRMDAACALAIMGNYVSDDCSVATFSTEFVTVPPRKGMALRDAIVGSQAHGGTELGKAVAMAFGPVHRSAGFIDADRVIVFTDEQSSDDIRVPVMVGRRVQHRYIINVATNEVGVAAAGGWKRISGFSEAIFTYIRESERIDSD